MTIFKLNQNKSMKKIVWKRSHGFGLPCAVKILLKMKLTLSLIFLSIFGALASESYSQGTRLFLDLKNTTIENVLESIENQSDFFFLYSEKVIDVNRKVSIDAKDESIEKILSKLFEGTGVAYTIKGRQIVLTSPGLNGSGGIFSTSQQRSVSGKVTDSGGGVLPGVTVMVKIRPAVL